MSPDRATVVAALVAVLLVVSAVPLPSHPTRATPDGTPVGTAGAPALPAQDGTALAAERTVVRIAVRPDGTGVWTVQYRVALDDPNTTARFESVGERIERDPLRYTGPYAETMSEAAAVASEETGREMAVRNVSVHARELPNGFGVVAYRFEWAGFAERGGDRLVVGDALVGFFLGENTTLVVQWPAGYEAATVEPSPDERRDRAAVWEGPVEFAPAEPRVVATGGGGLPLELGAAAVALVLVAAGAGVVAWRRREPTPEGSDEGATATEGEPAGGDATANQGEPAESGDDTGATGAGGTTAAGGAADEVPEELLSDAERVLGLVEERGGRMKQQEVVTALDWSETKTSQVVNDLREEGELEVYRIGRENVLALPGEMDV